MHKVKMYNDGTGQGPYTMTLTNHDVSEWARCAKAMYARGCNAEGHLLSACAAKGVVPIAQFDRAAETYRLWLCFDVPKNAEQSLAKLAQS